MPLQRIILSSMLPALLTTASAYLQQRNRERLKWLLFISRTNFIKEKKQNTYFIVTAVQIVLSCFTINMTRSIVSSSGLPIRDGFLFNLRLLVATRTLYPSSSSLPLAFSVQYVILKLVALIARNLSGNRQLSKLCNEEIQLSRFCVRSKSSSRSSSVPSIVKYGNWNFRL